MNGADAADACPLAWLNSFANWGPGANHVAPGATVHLVGAFTNALTVAGSGTAGRPVTLYFETGANFTTGCWPASGAIALNGQSNIIIDGGLNGIIQNTSNGTGLTTQNDSIGILGNGNSGGEVNFITIQNLTVTNIYNRIAGSSDPIAAGTCIEVSGSSITISNCNVSDGSSAIEYSGPGPGDTVKSNIFILNNRILNWDHGIEMGIGTSQSTNANCLLTNVVIAGNYLDHADHWDGFQANFHMDGIIIYNRTTDPTVVINRLVIRNNTFGSNIMSANTDNHGATAAIACYLDGPSTQQQNVFIFNNLFQSGSASNYWANTFANGSGSNVWVVNNTGIGVSDGFSICGVECHNYNNIFAGGGGETMTGIYGSQVGFTIPVSAATNLWVMTNYLNTLWSDYNVFPASPGLIPVFGLQLEQYMAGGMMWLAGIIYPFANWQNYGTAYWSDTNQQAWVSMHCDPHSMASLPTFVPGTYIPGANDTVARGKGTNLTWLGITNDFNGNPRPATGAWDVGAFVASSTSNGIAAVPTPTGVHVVMPGSASVFGTGLPPAASGASTNVTDGLLAWWPLDDASGADSSGNGHTGTFAGSPGMAGGVISNGLGWSGTVGQAMVFPAVSTSASTFTVTMWIFPSGLSANYQTLVFDTANNFGLMLNGVNLDIYASGADHLASTNLNLNTWYFVTAVVSSGVGTFYLNGTSAGTFAFNGSPAFNILASENPGNPFVGVMDDVRVYNRALTAGEVADLFNWRGQP